MDVAHIGSVHRDPCRCKIKGFRAVSSIERNVSKKHLQGLRHIDCKSFASHRVLTIVGYDFFPLLILLI